MRRGLVWTLYWSCWALDKLPYFDTEDRGWYRGLGCRIGLAQTACRLEVRWGII